MLTYLRLQRDLQHTLGELAEQPIRADQLDALLPGPSRQLLRHTLLVDVWLDRLLPHCLCSPSPLMRCHAVDRVSHGLSPLGFQTSHFNHSADNP